MLGLARFAMKSPLHTGVLAAVFAAIPMLYFVSAALVALTTLRHGITFGTRVLVMALVGGLFSWYMSGVPLSMLGLVVVTLLASVLKATNSWPYTLILGTVAAFVLSVLTQTFYGEQLGDLLESLLQVLLNGANEPVEQQFIAVARSMVGFIFMSTQYTEALLSLLLARYWQAGLYNPGGLSREMQQLRFSKAGIVLVLAAVVIMLFVNPGVSSLLFVPMAFIGLVTVHGVLKKLDLAVQWLIAFYVCLLLFIQFILPLLVLVVIVDSIVDLRSRIPERAKSDNE